MVQSQTRQAIAAGELPTVIITGLEEAQPKSNDASSLEGQPLPVIKSASEEEILQELSKVETELKERSASCDELIRRKQELAERLGLASTTSKLDKGMNQKMSRTLACTLILLNLIDLLENRSAISPLASHARITAH